MTNANSTSVVAVPPPAAGPDAKPQVAPTGDQLLGAIQNGMPLRKVEQLFGWKRGTLKERMNDDPAFATAVHQARAECMKERLKALVEAKQWQAATFMLESLWPQHFGRNRKPRAKPAASLLPGGPDQTYHFDQLTEDEQRTFDVLLAKLHGKRPAEPVERDVAGGAGQG